MTLVIALTGTPGTGKTATSRLMESRGYSIIDLNELAQRSGARTDYDEERDSWEVDIDALKDALAEKDLLGNVIMEGHWSHELHCDLVICLRCEPDELKARLSTREYSEEKIDENVWAEALSIIAVESFDNDSRVEQIDTTDRTENEVADLVEGIVAGETTEPIWWLDWLMENT